MTLCSFSGARELTDYGRRAICHDLERLDPATVIVVTGGCVGVDACVAMEATARGFTVHTVLPANRGLVDANWRAHCASYEELPPGTTYRDRNVRLVEIGTRLFAYPLHGEHDARSKRSGTWQTVRLARKAGRWVSERVIGDV